MYLGSHYSANQHWYDLIFLLEFSRSKTAEAADLNVKISEDSLPNLFTSFTGIMLNVLIRESRLLVGSKDSSYLADRHSKERIRLIKQNIKHLPVLINYCNNKLSISRTISDEEKLVIDFKRRCEFGEDSDLFVYEFNIEEIRHYLASIAGVYKNMKLKKNFDTSFIPKVQLVYMNYLIQFLIHTEVLWQTSNERLRTIKSLCISHYQYEKPATSNSYTTQENIQLSPTSLFIFISLSYSDRSFSQ